MKPFFYIIQHINTKVYYAGCKYSRDANPDLFMKEGGYQTSSKVVKRIIIEDGLNSFVVVRLKIFDAPEKAHDYETRFLKKVDAANNPRFFNMHNNNITIGHDDVDGSFVLYSSIGGKIQGKRNVESGHMERIRSMVDEERRIEAAKKQMYENKTGWLSLTEEQQKKYASMGGSVQGKRNVESGHMERIRSMVDEEKRIESVKKALREKKTGCFLDPKLRRMSSSLGGKKQGKRNAESGHLKNISSQYWEDVRAGKIIRLKKTWFNNGIIERKIAEGETVPEGFIKGRLKNEARA